MTSLMYFVLEVIVAEETAAVESCTVEYQPEPSYKYSYQYGPRCSHLPSDSVAEAGSDGN